MSRRAKERSDAVAIVALIGEGYRRSYVKDLLGGRAEITAELAADRRAHLLSGIGPEVVVLDCASEGINPLLALPKLSGLADSPRVVALTDGSVSRGLDADALRSLGADATADIRDSQAVVAAVLPGGETAPAPPSARPGRGLVVLTKTGR